MNPTVARLTIWDEVGRGLHEIVDGDAPPNPNLASVIGNHQPAAISERLSSVEQLMANIQQSIDAGGTAGGVPLAIVDGDGTTRYERLELGLFPGRDEFLARARELCARHFGADARWRVMACAEVGGEGGEVEVVSPGGVEEEWEELRGRLVSVFAVRGDAEGSVPMVIVGPAGGVVYVGKAELADWDRFSDFGLHVRGVMSELGQREVRLIVDDVMKPVPGGDYMTTPEGLQGNSKEYWLRFRGVFQLVCAMPHI